VAAILTQVVVDRNDPAMANPTKYIGQFYEEEQAKRFAKERGWQVKRDGDRGWRRVVASPIPKAIVEGPVIRAMVNGGAVVIAAGGGGIPVFYENDGRLEGLDVVIDKDRASAVLAKEIGAEMLIILTDADNAYLNYGKPDQRALSRVTIAEAKQYAAEGHFPPGSMGPKIEAALTFLESGGEKVIITSIEQSAAALDEKAGTIIVPN
jgi:carbamate kinase